MPFVVALVGHIVAVLSGLAILAAGLAHRVGGLDTRTALTIFKDAGWAAMGALPLCLVGVIVLLLKKQRRGLVPGIIGLAVSAGLTANTMAWKHQAESVPPIHDITTDFVHPPEFVAILPLRKDASNPVEYGGAEVAAQQQQAYPDVTPIIINQPPDKMFERALEKAKEMGWQIVATDSAAGRIEATDTTAWFGFKDDISIRVQTAPQGSRLDIRSLSRVGVSDVGTNAKRIRAYLDRVQKF